MQYSGSKCDRVIEYCTYHWLNINFETFAFRWFVLYNYMTIHGAKNIEFLLVYELKYKTIKFSLIYHLKNGGGGGLPYNHTHTHKVKYVLCRSFPKRMSSGIARKYNITAN
jgi:hypothetical protein